MNDCPPCRAIVLSLYTPGGNLGKEISVLGNISFSSECRQMPRPQTHDHTVLVCMQNPHFGHASVCKRCVALNMNNNSQ